MTTGQKLFHAGALLAILVVSCFAGLDAAPLFDKDEGAFSEATREMVTSGNYAIPYLNGEPRYDKPILIYWAQAAAMNLFGIHEWTARLPSALAAAAWMLMVYLFARRFLDAPAAFAAPIFLLGAVQVTVIAKAAIADSLLNLFITGALLAWWCHHDSRKRGWLLAAYAAMGLGFLTKGPIALLVPIGTVVLFAWTTGEFRKVLRVSFSWVGLGIFAAVNAPWYLYAIYDQGMPILEDWYRHVVVRGTTEMEGHGGPIFYYIPVVILGLLPFTAVLIHAARYAKIDWRLPLARFCMLWFLLTFVFFSLYTTKLPHYVVYGYPALALLMARRLPDLENDRWLVLPGFALLLFLTALPYLLGPIARIVDDEFAALVLSQAQGDLPVGYGWAVFSGAAILGLLLIAQTLTRDTKIAVTALIVLILTNLVVMPAAGRVMQEPVREAAYRSMDYPSEEVIMWRVNNPSFVFYRGEPTRTGHPSGGDVVFTRLPALQTLAEYNIIYERNGFVLARVIRTIDLGG